VNPVVSAFVIASGLFAIAGAYFDWDRFMNFNRRSRLIVALFGRAGARVFYGLLGVALVVFGTSSALGLLKK